MHSGFFRPLCCVFAIWYIHSFPKVYIKKKKSFQHLFNGKSSEESLDVPCNVSSLGATWCCREKGHPMSVWGQLTWPPLCPWEWAPLCATSRPFGLLGSRSESAEPTAPEGPSQQRRLMTLLRSEKKDSPHDQSPGSRMPFRAMRS